MSAVIEPEDTDVATPSASADPRFSPAHVEYLTRRAVPLDLAQRASLRSVDGARGATLLGRDRALPCGGLSIPYPGIRPLYVRLRLDHPERCGGVRYLAPGQRAGPLYIPPGDDAQPLLVVESPIKALAMMGAGHTAVGLGGTGTTLTKGEHALNDSWKAVLLALRIILILFDANRRTNPAVARDEARLAIALEHAGAIVKVAALPAGPGGEGWGPDDFLAARGAPALAEVLATAQPADPAERARAALEAGGAEAVSALLDDLPFLAALRERGAGAQARAIEALRKAKIPVRLLDHALRDLRDQLRAADRAQPRTLELDEQYGVKDGCLCSTRPGPLGPETTVLCNFDARIVEEAILDDELEEQRRFVVEGEAPDGTRFPPVTLSANELQSTRWPLERWGHRAIMHPAAFAPAEVCTAILGLSEPRSVRIYRHTGWREVDGHWVFLHGGGAIGPASARVELDGPLARYVLPDRTEDAVAAVRASLRLLDLAPRVVTMPLFGVLYRAPTVSIFPADLVAWLYGPTGVMKSTLAAILLRHLGNFTRLQMPASWSDTAASLEYKLWVGKDPLVPIDDFAPRSSDPSDEVRRKAALVLRSAGNGSGRGRMKRDLTARVERAPRALALVTGEDAPDGESITARMLPIRLGPGMVNVKALSALQAEQALLPHAMRAYLEWMAQRYEEIAAWLPEFFERCRDVFRVPGVHRRIPEAAAHTFLGHGLFLRFARDLGVLDDRAAARHFDEAREALVGIGHQQAQLGSHANPARRFLEVLASLHAQGHLGFATRPEDALVTTAACEQIGWRDRDRKVLYILPDALYSVVGNAMRSAGEPMPFRGRTRTGKLRELRMSVVDLDADAAFVLLQDELRKVREGASETAPAMIRFSDYAVSLLERKISIGEIKSAQTRAVWSTALEHHLLPVFGDFLLDRIRRTDIEEWKLRGAARVNEGAYSPHTVNGWLAILRVILNTPVAELELERNPVAGVKSLDTSTHATYTDEEPNALTIEEVPRFLAALRTSHPQFFAMTALGFATGMRPSSPRPLRRCGPTPDVLWDEGVLLVRRSHTRRDEVMETTKNKRHLRITLPEELMAILRWHVAHLPEGPMLESELLFPSEVGGFRSTTAMQKPFAAVAKATGIKKRITPRAMRRTFQDLARAAEVKDVVTRAVSGHVTEVMQRHYSTVNAEEMRQGLARVVSLAGFKEAMSRAAVPAGSSGVLGGVLEPKKETAGV